MSEYKKGALLHAQTNWDIRKSRPAQVLIAVLAILALMAGLAVYAPAVARAADDGRMDLAWTIARGQEVTSPEGKDIDPTTIDGKRVDAGRDISYQLQVSCSDVNVPCNEVEVTVPLPVLQGYEDEVLTTYKSAQRDSRQYGAVPTYNKDARTITWRMDSVPSGQATTLNFVVSVPNRISPNGTPITTDATVNYDTGEVTSDASPVVTVKADESFKTDKRRITTFESVIQDLPEGADPTDIRNYTAPTIYSVSTFHTAMGGSNGIQHGSYTGGPRYGVLGATEIVTRDTLPEGAVLLKAETLVNGSIRTTEGYTYDEATRTIKFDAWNSVTENIAPNYRIYVGFPRHLNEGGAGLTLGQTVVNVADATYTLATSNETGQTPEQNVEDTLQEITGGPGGYIRKTQEWKRAAQATPGSSLTFTITARNTGIPRTRFEYEDLLPCGLSSEQGALDCEQPALKDVDFRTTTELPLTLSFTTNKGREDEFSLTRADNWVKPQMEAGEWITFFKVKSADYLFNSTDSILNVRGVVPEGLDLLEQEETNYRHNEKLWDSKTNGTEEQRSRTYIENCLASGTFRVDGMEPFNALRPVTKGDLNSIEECGYAWISKTKPSLGIEKSVRGGVTNINAGEEGALKFRITGRQGASTASINPIITDLLPEGVTVVKDSVKNNGTSGTNGELPNELMKVEIIDNFEDTGRQLLRVTWPGARGLAPAVTSGSWLYLDFDTTVAKGTPEGTYENSILVGDSQRTSYNTDARPNFCSASQTLSKDELGQVGNQDPDALMCASSTSYTVIKNVEIGGTEYVKGSLDSEYKGNPGVGLVLGGENAAFRMNLQNTGTSRLRNVIAYDVLPHVGDTGVRLPEQQRDSEWRAILTGPVSFAAGTPQPVSILYNHSTDACRGEVVGDAGEERTSAPAGCDDNWMTAEQVGDDWGSILAIRVDFGEDNIMEAGETWTVDIPTIADPDAPGGTAWNSFAVAAKDADSDTHALSVEPAKVGIQVPLTGSLGKRVSADTTYQPGDIVTWELFVHNAGPGNGNDLVVDEIMPPSGIEFIDAVVDEGSTFDPKTMQWTIPRILPDPVCVKAESKEELNECAKREMGEGISFDNMYTVEAGQKAEPLNGWTKRMIIRAKVLEETQGSDLINTAKLSRSIEENLSVIQEATATASVGVDVTGTVWHDRDANGNLADATSEPRLEGVKVTLRNPDGSVVKNSRGEIVTTETDENGNYTFRGVPGGAKYTVSYEYDSLPDNDAEWFRTFDKDMGKDLSNATITVLDENVENVNFGVALPATIGDYVWYDANGNGIQDEGDRPFEGVTVTVTAADGTKHETTTDENGKWEVTGLFPGGYTVQFGTPVGYAPTGANKGNGSDDSRESVVTSVQLRGGDVVENMDFGLVGAGVVGDTVFNDANRDNIQNNGETGIANAIVVLLKKDGEEWEEVSSTTTDANGKYSFSALEPGTYKVNLIDPSADDVKWVPGRGYELDEFTLAQDNGFRNVEQDFPLHRLQVVTAELKVEASAEYWNDLTWDIAKSAPKNKFELAPGETLSPEFEVTVTKTVGAFKAGNGSIKATLTLTNPENTVAVIQNPQIATSVGGSVTCALDDESITLQPNTTSTVEVNCGILQQRLDDAANLEELEAGFKDVELTFTFEQTGTETAPVAVTAKDEEPALQASPENGKNYTAEVNDTLYKVEGESRTEVENVDPFKVDGSKDKWTFPYTSKAALSAPAGTCVNYANEATLTSADAEDKIATADVDICATKPVEDGDVEADATASFDRIYGWDLKKETVSAETTPIEGSTDLGVSLDYDVTATELAQDVASHSYTGTFKVTNNDAQGMAPWRVLVTAKSDLFGECVVNNASAAQTIASGQSLTYGFECDVPADYNGELKDTLTYTVTRIDNSGHEAVSFTKEVTGTVTEFDRNITVEDVTTGDKQEFTWGEEGPVHTLAIRDWDAGGLRIPAGKCVSVDNTANLIAGQDRNKASATVADQLCNVGISGNIYVDTDRDGNNLSGLPHYEGKTTVELLDAAGKVIATQETTDGTFVFTGHPAGEYQVRVTTPSEVGFTPQRNNDPAKVNEGTAADAGSDDPTAESVTTFKFTTNGDNANVTNVDFAVFVFKPVEVTANLGVSANYFNTYEWDVAKAASSARYNVAPGAEVSPEFTVTVTNSDPILVPQAGTEKVWGLVTITNTEDREVSLESVTINLVGIEGATCTPSGTLPETIDANASIEVGFDCILPESLISGAQSAEQMAEILQGVKASISVETADTATQAAEIKVSDDDADLHHDEEADQNKTVTVTDVLSYNGNPEQTPVLFEDGTVTATPDKVHTFTYKADPLTAVAGSCTPYVNTVTVGTGDAAKSADATYTLCAGAQPGTQLDGAVKASFDRTYGWTLEKKNDRAEVVERENGTWGVELDYTITATETEQTVANHTYSGVIVAQNNDPETMAAMRVRASATSARFGACTVDNSAAGNEIATGGSQSFAFSCPVPANYNGELTDTLSYTIERIDGSGVQPVTGTAEVTGTVVEFDKNITVADTRTPDVMSAEWTAVGHGHELKITDFTDGDREILAGQCLTVDNSAVLRTANGDILTTDTADLCLYQISGSIFETDNNSGEDLAGSALYEGEMTVELLNESGAVIDTVSTKNGRYSFANKAAGRYAVRFLAPNGMSFTRQANSTVGGIQEPGQTDAGTDDKNASEVTTPVFPVGADAPVHVPTVDAALYPTPPDLAAITGTIYNDADRDGRMTDEDTVKLGGVVVQLLDENGAVIRTATTDELGQYTFDGLNKGTYSVRVVNSPALSGLEQTGDPASHEVEEADVVDEEERELSPVREITVDWGETSEANNFGYATELLDASLSGTVYGERDNDGDVSDPQEPQVVVPGATVSLFYADGRPVLGANGEQLTAVTNAAGQYAFANVRPGSFRMSVALPSGWRMSAKAMNSSLGVNSSGEAGRSASIGEGEEGEILDIVLGSDENKTHIDVVAHSNANVSGTFFDDVDGDGVRGDNEKPIVGVKVELLDEQGKVVEETLTDESGKYIFENVFPGEYSVRFSVNDPESVISTKDSATGINVGTNNASTSDNPRVGTTSTFTVEPGQDIEGVDAASTGAPTEDPVVPAPEVGSVSGTVWMDNDRNANLDGTEAGRIQSVVVELIDAEGRVVARTATDAAGNYKFDNVVPGEYTVVVIDVNPALNPFEATTERSIGITVEANEETGGHNFGFANPEGEPAPEPVPGLAAITGTVWIDSDEDQAIDEDEAVRIGAVDVELIDADGNVVASTQTDASGRYTFNGVEPGSYTVRIAETENNEIALGEHTATTLTTVDVTVAEGEVGTADFGYVAPAPELDPIEPVEPPEEDPQRPDPVDPPPSAKGGVSGTVWRDEDRDGLIGADEARVAGALVRLYDDNGNVVAETLTDADGFYSFGDIEPGHYVVRVYGNDETDGLASTTVIEYEIEVEPELVNDLNNFGFAIKEEDVTPVPDNPEVVEPAKVGTITGLIFNDVDRDGVIDPDEYGVSGVIVELIDENGEVIATVTTDEFGRYKFDNVPEGNYQIRVVNLDSYEQTYDVQRGTTNPAATIEVSVGEGEIVEGQNFGYVVEADPTPGQVGSSELELKEILPWAAIALVPIAGAALADIGGRLPGMTLPVAPGGSSNAAPSNAQTPVRSTPNTTAPTQSGSANSGSVSGSVNSGSTSGGSASSGSSNSARSTTSSDSSSRSVSRTLANTGASVIGLLILAGILMLVGIMLVVRGNRRQEDQ